MPGTGRPVAIHRNDHLRPALLSQMITIRKLATSKPGAASQGANHRKGHR